MKRIIALVSLTLMTMIGNNISAQQKDSQGHSLVNLWKSYDKAIQADKPKEAMDVLETIKGESREKKLAWDFYDAGRKYVQAGSSVDWKERRSLEAARLKELEEFGQPIIQIFESSLTSDLGSFVQKNKEALMAGHNSEFYSNDTRITRLKFSSALVPLIQNDYEYAIWCLSSNDGTQARAYYSGKYPFAAFLDYNDAMHSAADQRAAELRKVANRYQGQAAAMLAKDELLDIKYSRLVEAKALSSEYLALKAECEQFRKDCKKFSGSESRIADCCKHASNLLNEFKSQWASASIQFGKMSLSLRNLAFVNVRFTKDGKAVYEEKVQNKEGSFYALDEISLDLPPMPDGIYDVSIKSGNVDLKMTYNKYSLSAASRCLGNHTSVYVADYRTGEPVRLCRFQVLDSSERLVMESADVKMDGFTRLPDTVEKALVAERYRRLRVAAVSPDGLQRLSKSMYMNSNPRQAVKDDADKKNARIITDRRAFNPGETVHFKALLYDGEYEYSCAGEGRKVKLVLKDPQGRELAEKELISNEFGSVAGEFELVKSDRGGKYVLELYSDTSLLDSVSLTVDEFVLPSFEVQWDKDSQLYFHGDKVKIGGRLTSYSGHSLSLAKAQYRLKLMGRAEEAKEVKIAPDGRFVIEFVAGSDYWHEIELIVSDATGETLSFSTVKRISDYIPLNVKALNNARGECDANACIFSGRTAKFGISVGNDEVLERKGLQLDYALMDGAKVILAGPVDNGSVLELPLDKLASGHLYHLVVNGSAKTSGSDAVNETQKIGIVKADRSCKFLDMDVDSFFMEPEGDDLSLCIGSTTGATWAVVELIGNGDTLLDCQIVKLSGRKGKEGSFKTISYARKASYPEYLLLKVLWFKNGKAFQYKREFDNHVQKEELPLKFTRFLDTTLPGSSYSFQITTAPNAECAATIFDLSTETIAANLWQTVKAPEYPKPHVSYSVIPGEDGSGYSFKTMRSRADSAVNEMVMDYASESPIAMAGVAEEGAIEVRVRENFASTVAWEPFLRSDKDGKIEFSFTNADKLSSFAVQLLAHDRQMRTATLRREMLVTIPVKVATVQPLHLYAGDRYFALASLSNNTNLPVSGTAVISFLNSADRMSASVIETRQQKLTVPAYSSIAFEAQCLVGEDIKDLGLLVSFIADKPDQGSDAVFVSMPVAMPVQTLTESHSALLRNPADRDALIETLRSLFQNGNGADAVVTERNIRQMLEEAIPEMTVTTSDDAISLSDALYADCLLARLKGTALPEEAQTMLAKLKACQDANGGFAWFEGMKPSPLLTAVVLQRLAQMKEVDLVAAGISISAAVSYLDDQQFATSLPSWCGGVSIEQYLHTRSMFPELEFKTNGIPSKQYKLFCMEVKAYLVPSRDRGLEGRILSKARRLTILRNLLTLPGGDKLAKQWGIGTGNKLRKSLKSDVESLQQYAVDHSSGGKYYPNAVMPCRGLLESELYAHALLCNLFSSIADGGLDQTAAEQLTNVAEGIRLWLMVQKETQEWNNDPSTIEALAAVLQGTSETLDTKVLALSLKETLPFRDIEAAGNGFTIERHFFRGDVELKDGDILHVGDKVRAEYRIWNKENRSFVRLTAPRPACFRPEDQISGHYGWWLRPLRVDAIYNIVPQGYRSVLSDRTEYWFDSYPEENTTIVEYFLVSQKGTFQTPVEVIESLYAPHYRANGSGISPISCLYGD